ncbi:hypothetical protein pneo_cds_195 [Pandoravirus neocaledonia]|uniref:Uncharacterized protein n=1 Tax=Pandoravirus neocaledonia TaxID=2107708 RepID=A0A2U7UBN6_9VIRU|nr:hypothetical protein pneo_cds_195 [Pandoravirus neocaledonia]AVK75802.1 hypothetical protein pneo_cds_195 [Pandoravirus neocaledonia]
MFFASVSCDEHGKESGAGSNIGCPANEPPSGECALRTKGDWQIRGGRGWGKNEKSAAALPSREKDARPGKKARNRSDATVGLLHRRRDGKQQKREGPESAPKTARKKRGNDSCKKKYK